MNAVLERAMYHLTNKTDLTEVSEDDLHHIVEQHPYFAAAQLALSLKLDQDKSYKAKSQLEKTALYFPNTDWLYFQLQNGITKKFEPSPEILLSPASKPVAAPVTVQPASSTIERETEQLQDSFTRHIPTVESVKEMLHQIDHSTETPAITHLTNTDIPGSVFNNTISGNLPKESTVQPQGNFERNIFDPSENQLEKYASLISTQAADFKKPAEKEENLEFELEPYYTIDYFASQGIKADLTKQPDDKLSKQLLKFTDWLKKMKAVNPNPNDLGTDPELERAIQGIAQTSNEAKEIATETMAEVFVKQGKIDKAVQLYIKLSFLDPEKSSYFASKIQQLKGM